MSLSTNPAYKLEATFGEYNIYLPVDITNYHMSRYVQLQHQLIYANAGTTAERLQEIANEILNRCNLTTKLDNRITDIGVLANEILYRTKYPVDEHCAIRVGAVLCFIEWEEDNKKVIQGAEHTAYRKATHSEDPTKYDIFYTRKKEELAFSNPEAYAFFLTWGISNIDKYRQHFDTSISLDYFSKRQEALRSLTVQSVSK